MIFSSVLRFLILYTPMPPSVSNEGHSMMSSDWLIVALLLHALHPASRAFSYGTYALYREKAMHESCQVLVEHAQRVAK